MWLVACGWSREDGDEEQFVEDRRWCQYRAKACRDAKKALCSVLLEHGTET